MYYFAIIILIMGWCSSISSTIGNRRTCFSGDFLLGTATSSYQIEGGWNADGKGENMWDWYTHTYPERVADGTNGDIAADSYHKYKTDVDILEDLGVDFYRFSISWTRILPDGTVNNINQAGVEYYSNLIKRLKAKNITPLVTLYHWELPLTLHKKGGWTNPETANYFAKFASLCYELFGNDVKHWITINEPFTQCYLGYGIGSIAPGLTESGTSTYRCFYAMLLAHAKAYRIYEKKFKNKQKGEVGIVLLSHWYEPLTDSADDKIASQNAVQWMLGLAAHPVLIGNWPQVVIDRVGYLSAVQGFNTSRLPTLTTKEIEFIKGSYDFLGLNYYTTYYATPMANLSTNTTVSFNVDMGVSSSVNESWTQAASSWLYDTPEGLRKLLNWISQNYRNPKIIITENGWSDARESLLDFKRIDYVRGHLCNVLSAKYEDKVNIFGYTYWSFLDCFEWDNGYSSVFGLLAIDLESSNRTRNPKASYFYYKSIISSRCIDFCPGT